MMLGSGQPSLADLVRWLVRFRGGTYLAAQGHGGHPGHGPGLGGVFVIVTWAQAMREAFWAFWEQYGRCHSLLAFAHITAHLPVATFTGLVLWALMTPLMTAGLIQYGLRLLVGRHYPGARHSQAAHGEAPLLRSAEQAVILPARELEAELLEVCVRAAFTHAVSHGRLGADVMGRANLRAVAELTLQIEQDPRLRALAAAASAIAKEIADQTV